MIKKLLVVNFLVSLVLIANVVIADTSLYGIYSNIDNLDNEPSGMEVFLLNNGMAGKCAVSVLFQVAEGSPQYPELLDCCSCSVRQVIFHSKELDRFVGGEFIDMWCQVKLKKGKSYWQIDQPYRNRVYGCPGLYRVLITSLYLLSNPVCPVLGQCSTFDTDFLC